RYEQFGDPLVRDTVLGTEFIELRLARDAQLRAQRARRIVDAGVDDLAVARARLRADDVVLLEHHDLAPAHGQSPRDGEADDARADDNSFDISCHGAFRLGCSNRCGWSATFARLVAVDGSLDGGLIFHAGA